MNGSGHLREDYAQPMHLCPCDLAKLQALLGFDVAARYKQLESFFRDNSFAEEHKWMQNMLLLMNKSLPTVK